MTALARVRGSRDASLRLPRKVIWPAPALASGATPVITQDGSPCSSAPIRLAISPREYGIGRCLASRAGPSRADSLWLPAPGVRYCDEPAGFAPPLRFLR